MKKLLSVVAALIAVTTLSAQQPVITFEKTTHDFGKINEADGRVTTVFTFKNEGMSPLVLSNVRASCGCTTPKWTKEPVEPGQTGDITVTYNPNGRPGRFQKTITVTSNATEGTVKLFIKGEVIPKPAKPVDNYPVKMGVLSLKSQTMDFGNIMDDTIMLRTMAYANQTTDTFTLSCYTKDNAFLYAGPGMEKQEMQILPKTEGQLTFQLAATATPIYGPLESRVYMVINGKQIVADSLAVFVKANIQENFARLTADELAKAPVAIMEKTINLGTFQKGKKAVATFHMTNAGLNNLIVRRLIINKDQMGAKATKSIRSNKKGTITINLLPMEAGNYASEMTIITNDPKQPVQTISLNWTIEK